VLAGFVQAVQDGDCLRAEEIQIAVHALNKGDYS
jgi:hypothetical protein